MVTAKKNAIAAIGNFDGVHRGHQALLAATKEFAAAYDARPGVVLFEPHPRRYFRPDDPPFLLTSSAQRDELLRAHGAEEIFAVTFDASLAAQTPEEFVHGVLKKELDLAGVVAGVDFHFGAMRAGDSAALRSLGAAAGMNIKIVDLLAKPDTEKFGSSATRNALRAGNVRAAADILGRPWSARGKVLEGQKLGRTLGFPTANMTLGDLIEPRKGVYATYAHIDGRSLPAISNFGRRPTVGDSPPLLETHVFDFDGDLYGKEIGVAFIDFLRDERKFDGLDALKAQIDKDCARARRLLA